MNNEEIQQTLIQLTYQLVKESQASYQREIRIDDSFKRHLGIDSLASAELFRRIEKELNLTLPDSLLAKVDSLKDIMIYLETATRGGQPVIAKTVMASHGKPNNINPAHAQTLQDVIQLYGESAADRVHLYFQHDEGYEEKITYGEMFANALKVAAGLQYKGLQVGETVAIMQPTTPNFFYIFLGTLLAGGIPVPIYPPFRAHMLEAYAKMEARILRNAEARFLITFTQAEQLSRLLQAFVPSLKCVTTFEDLQIDSLPESIVNMSGDDAAFIQYTSGSTSDPKGVLLSHYNLLSNIRAYGKAIQLRADDVAVSWLPLYHDFGLIGSWLGSLYHGVPLILMTPFAFLNHPERWMWAIHYHRGTISGAPNFAYDLCVRKIETSRLEGLDLSSWRIAANGAEKVYPRTLEEFSQRFKTYGFKAEALMPVYGLAESTVGLTIPVIDRLFRIDYVDRYQFEHENYAVSVSEKTDNALSFVSCGIPIEGHEIRIVDPDGTPLSERKVGELQFRGPSSMQGYYNNPSATKLVFFEEGWVASGDLAYQADGEVFIAGRRKDLIIKAGRNIYPVEIEEVVGHIAGIRQGCVTAFGVTDAEQGTEQLVIVAETNIKDQEQRASLMTEIRNTISAALDIAPDQIVLAPPRVIPKTSSGKLQRSACKTLYLTGQLTNPKQAAWVQMLKLGLSWGIKKSAIFATQTLRFFYTVYVIALVAISFIPFYGLVLLSNRNLAAKICKGWAKFLLFVAGCKLKQRGFLNVLQQHPMIYVANHASYLDAIIALSVLPSSVRFIGKKELTKTPILKTFMAKLQYFSVDRFDFPQGIEDTKKIEGALREGISVLIFPEGTFGYAMGLRPFRLGAFKVAAEVGIPVCPIALNGTRHIWRNKEKFLRPGEVEVTVCEPISARGSSWQDITQLSQAARAKIAEFCGEPTLDFIAAGKIASNAR